MKRTKSKDASGNERAFSIELDSRRSLKNVTLANGTGDRVLVEGTIGRLVRATFAEGVILEIVGREGVLRVDLAQDEITKPAEGSGSGVSGQ
jgi:hypothetical protein